MTKKEILAEKAVEYKHNGCNCAQAVVKAMSEYVDVNIDDVVKMTSGFGVGMGCMEATCGSLIGANMIAGLLKDGKGTMPKSRELLLTFKDMCGGATICKDLKGIETGVVLCPCDDCVRNAVKSLYDVMGLE